jgi:hypothetical protein
MQRIEATIFLKGKIAHLSPLKVAKHAGVRPAEHIG